MRVTRQQAAENRSRVLRLASLRFRERGLRDVGVAGLMQEAGLTHGGFYKQFSSKEELITRACAAAIWENLEGYRGVAAGDKRHPLKATVEAMLSMEHVENWRDGCAMAALGPEIARGDAETRREVTKGVRAIVDWLASLVTGRRARKRALASYATIVGALLLARAVDEKELSEEFLEAAREALL
jgi:TetR/AcrR family transcriptional repressor of nem operon